MKHLLNFLIEVGKLKRMPRRGWILIGQKNPETIGEHTFHETIMVWLLAQKRGINLNIERLIKITLIHDICELYAGDITPYDDILPKNKKEWPKLFDTWPRFTKSKKIKNFIKKHKKEKAALTKIIAKLPPATRKEIMGLWVDYEKGLTKEGRFARQVGRLATLFQALEYSKQSKRRPYKSWWLGSKERIDDPLLLEFMEALAKKYHQKLKY